MARPCRYSVVASGAGALGLAREMGESCRLADGQVREALPIERHAGCFQTVHELAVAQPVFACGGVDSYDPKPPEVALLAPPPNVGVGEGRVDRLFRRAISLLFV